MPLVRKYTYKYKINAPDLCVCSLHLLKHFSNDIQVDSVMYRSALPYAHRN